MAEFCSICEPKYHDTNLAKLALDLKRAYSSNFWCEGCFSRALYKDGNGLLFLVIDTQNEDLEMKPVKLEEL